jgi:hypothetical protein
MLEVRADKFTVLKLSSKSLKILGVGKITFQCHILCLSGGWLFGVKAVEA